MSQSNEEPILVLKPASRQWLGLCAAASGACISLGFSLALFPVPHFLVWLGVGFAGIAGLAFVGHFLPGNSALILTPNGFTVRSASRIAFYPWSEVAYFAVADERLVAFRLLDTSERKSPIVRESTGFDGALSARYGTLSAEALAAQLNECLQILGEREGI